MDILEIISDASNYIIQADESISDSNINVACDSLALMDEALKNLHNESILEYTPTFGILKNEGRIIHSRFESRLKHLVYQCIRVERGRCIVRKQISIDETSKGSQADTFTDISRLWEAMLRVGIDVKPIVMDITLEIWTNMITPLWREKKLQHPRVTVGSEQAEMTLDFASPSPVVGADMNAQVVPGLTILYVLYRILHISIVSRTS